MRSKSNLIRLLALLSTVLFYTMPLHPQVKIGDQTPPQPYSILELSTAKTPGGLRLPQVTTLERDQLAVSTTNALSPGLTVYNTDTNCIDFWNGSKWISLCNPPSPCTALTGVSIASSAGFQLDLGSTTTLSASPLPANADGPFTNYQWAKLVSGTWTDIAGATGATCNVPTSGTYSIQVGTNEYRVTMTGHCGGAQSGTTAIFGNTPGEDFDDVPPPNFLGYVGAFWKSDQRGERLIRIARPTVHFSYSSGVTGTALNATEQAVADGAWRATVLIGVDWIELDQVMTSDGGVSWTSIATPADMNTPANDAQYRIPAGTGLTTVSGTMNAGTPQIYFRIGLKSTYTPTATAPARYGVVLLTYKDNTKMHRIFVRQGHDPDYLMRPDDPLAAGSAAGTTGRTTANTKRFSPYNLTATSLNAQVAQNGGTFTAYPSQSGALWLYTGSGASERRAWDANAPGGTAATSSNGYWSTAHETCPANYALSSGLGTANFRRPNDGRTDTESVASGQVTLTDYPISEVRHSLFLKLDRTTNSDPGFIYYHANTIWGYYADGFFDRRRIVNSPDMTAATGEALSTVSAGNANIAHSGLLYFNPYNNASLFFPGAGFRNGMSGALTSVGNNGLYYTSSAGEFDFFAAFIGFGSDAIKGRAVGIGNDGRNVMGSIRCVRD